MRSGPMEQMIEAFAAGFGILWKALWALIFGCTISAGIQVLISRSQMAQTLGDRGIRQAGLAGFFGLISSSCSFAALAASRSVLTKGAHPVNAGAFLVASTNRSVRCCGSCSAGSLPSPIGCLGCP